MNNKRFDNKEPIKGINKFVKYLESIEDKIDAILQKHSDEITKSEERKQ